MKRKKEKGDLPVSFEYVNLYVVNHTYKDSCGLPHFSYWRGLNNFWGSDEIDLYRTV